MGTGLDFTAETRKHARTMRQQEFSERLRDAAEHAGVEFSPTAIGRALGISKQTAHKWMIGGEPRGAMVFHIADTWRVDPRWLATGNGHMLLPPGGPGLSADEIEILKRYRGAGPRARPSIVAVVKSLAKTAGVAVLVISFSMVGFNKTSVAAQAPLRAQFDSNTHWFALRRFLRRAFAMLNRSDRLIAI